MAICFLFHLIPRHRQWCSFYEDSKHWPCIYNLIITIWYNNATLNSLTTAHYVERIWSPPTTSTTFVANLYLFFQSQNKSSGNLEILDRKLLLNQDAVVQRLDMNGRRMFIKVKGVFCTRVKLVMLPWSIGNDNWRQPLLIVAKIVKVLLS